MRLVRFLLSVMLLLVLIETVALPIPQIALAGGSSGTDLSSNPCAVTPSALSAWLTTNYPNMISTEISQIVGTTAGLCATETEYPTGMSQNNSGGKFAPTTPPPGVSLSHGCGNRGSSNCQAYVPVVNQVTKGISISNNGHGYIQIGSITVPVTASGTGPYETQMALVVAAAPGIVTVNAKDCTTLHNHPNQFQLKYGGPDWPSSLRGKPFTYPSGPGFLATLQQYGWLGNGPINVSDAPSASRPDNVYNAQPTGGDISKLSGFPSLKHVLLPGKLYINTQLRWSASGHSWHVAEWNYNYEIDTSFIDAAAACAIQNLPPRPPPGSGPPANGGPVRSCPYGENANGTCITTPPASAPAPSPSQSSQPPLSCQRNGNRCPKPKAPLWIPYLVCGGPIYCNKDFPGSRLPGQFIPEPCDPNAPLGDPDRCPGSHVNP